MSPASLLPLRREFLSRLASARELAYPLFRGSHPRTALSGPPTEFDGHRPYLPGDDTRWIDWNLFARLEELYVKVFEVEEEVEVLVMQDVSLSMTSAPGRKHRTASSAAEAFAYLALLTAHPVSTIRYAERALESRGPYRNLQAFPALVDLLTSPPRGKGTDLAGSLSPTLLHRRRPVTVIALTDGFQRDPLEKVITVVKNLENCRAVLVRIVDPADSRPPLRGNLLLHDIEGADSRAVLSGRSLETQVHGRIAAHFRNLEMRLRQAGLSVFSLPVDEPFEDCFLGLLRSALPPDTKGAVR
jgi:uncharacterized protein (DUF58 family)